MRVGTTGHAAWSRFFFVRVGHGDGPVACLRRTVLLPRNYSIAHLARQMHEHGEAARSIHQRPDGGAVQADDQITFPMSRHGTTFCLCRPTGDHHLLANMSPCLGLDPGPWPLAFATHGPYADRSPARA